MTAPTNTATTLSQKGNREQLTDILERVAPENTPFTSNCGEGPKATAVLVEWQTEDLAAPSATGVLEGSETSTYEENITTRLGNYTQIRRRAFVVSGTQETVNKAGRKSEIDRHRVLKAIEVKRDFETIFLGNSIARQQATTDPRLCAGIQGWLSSNVSRGAGGANGVLTNGIVTTAATNGTQRAFNENQVKTVMQSIFNNSGTAKKRTMYMSAFHKQIFSGFAGISEIRNEVSGQKQAVIYGAADAYMSDFGMLVTVPVAYGLTRDVLVIDHEYVGISTLRAIFEEKLAKTGDNEKRHIIGEKTLAVKNQRALGIIADLTTS
jgi:hypothetical protein